MPLTHRSRRAAGAVVLSLLVALGAAPRADAATATPERTVVAPTCGRATGADVASGAGLLRGFAGLQSGACGGRVVYVQGGSQGWTQVATPYRGLVLSAAADDVATYLLYVVQDASGRSTGLGITKRSHDGRFFPTTVLTTTPSDPAYGDVAAYGGRWWAVWTEQVGSGTSAHTQLFQAGTVGASTARRQMTATPAAANDTEPSVSVDRGGAVVAWTRTEGVQFESPSDVWVAVARSTGEPWQRARALLTDGTQNASPDVVRTGAVTLVGAFRDGRVLETDNSSGTFRTHVFLVEGDLPRVGVSNGSLFVAWTAGTSTDASSRVLVARGVKGGAGFSSAYASGYGAALTSLAATEGRATVLVQDGARVFSRTLAL